MLAPGRACLEHTDLAKRSIERQIPKNRIMRQTRPGMTWAFF